MQRATRTLLPERLAACLAVCDPATKVACVDALWRDWQADAIDAAATLARTGIDIPGRPDKPDLVAPDAVPRRRPGTRAGHAALIHALAHIEFNAINLALDAAHRFAGLPRAFYADWLRVAAEEATHFTLLERHLASLGFAYGDFSAHAGLWEMAQKTAHDPLVRMALVPRVLEARGLDATPAIARKLAAVGDRRAVEILAVIERDEIGHVAVGSRWFAHLCALRGFDPQATFRGLLSEYAIAPPRAPLNVGARRLGGFGDDELAWLGAQSEARRG
jgi:uncharacterized ferritin-like protein (DUF455 family)